MASNEITIAINARDNATRVLSGISRSIGRSVEASRRFAFGIGAAGTALSGVVGIGAKVAGDLEAARMGFITLLGSAEKADAILDRIKKDAASTPFELPGLVKANQLLTSVTKDGDRAQDMLLNVGKALAAMGGGQAELDRIIVNLQQIGAVGRASMLDIKQFAFAGIPIFELLKEELGATGEELESMISGGEITFELLEELFKTAGAEGGRFAEAFSNQAGTFNQLVSNMKDNLVIFLNDMLRGTGIFDGMKNAISGVNDFLSKNSDKIQEYISGGLAWIKDNGDLVAGIILGGLAPAFGALALSIAGGLASLAPFMAAGAILVPLIKDWIQQNGGLKNTIDRLSERFDEIRKPVMDFFNAVSDFLLPKLKDLWAAITEDLMPTLKRLWDTYLKKVVEMVGVTLVAALGVAIDVLTLLAENFEVVSAVAVAMGTVFVGAKVFGAITTVTTAISGAGGLRPALGNLGKFLNNPANLISPWALISGAAITAAVLIIDKYNETKRVVDNMKRGLEGMHRAQDDALRRFQDLVNQGKRTENELNRLRFSVFLGNIDVLNSRISHLGLQISGAAAAGATFGSLPGRQHGGPVTSGVPYVVGENGPEVFVPRSGGTIVDNQDMNQASASPQNINIGKVILDSSERVDQFFRELDRRGQLRQFGMGQ